jgi:uncharacterized protein
VAALRQPPVIEAFGGGGFRIDGQRHDGSVLILADTVHAWPARVLGDATPTALQPALTASPELVELILLGAGSAMALAPKALRQAATLANLGLEVLSTPEACRMYNYLAGEGRRVAAALIAV